MARARFEIRVIHDELGEAKVISGTDPYVVEQRARKQERIWDEKWRRQQERERKQANKELAIEKTVEAQKVIEDAENTLKHTLGVDDKVDWDDLQDSSLFLKPRPTEPESTASKYEPQMGCLAYVIPSMKQRALEEAAALFREDYDSWKALDAEWEAEKAEFLREQQERNEAVDRQKEGYFNQSPSAIVAYCEMVLGNSSYPESFPQQFELDYNPDNKVLIVEYQLPSPDDAPALKEVKYVQSRDEFKEVFLPDATRRKLYDGLIYQIALRAIHELYEADVVEAMDSIVFNGWVESVDVGTGQDITPCIVSIQAKREEFLVINLEKVDPKVCFKTLKGIAGSRLHKLTPIAPLLTIDREDKRFVDAYGVVDGLDESHNLAAMDWEDFENLVRELFEKEFSQSGGEVKVTRASRDGGVDAVAFDPDPIRGGKIVIQAKRYTNVVGVSAVRDLYGTVINEGATKGILITTADYGPDAYEFVKGKPLTLLNGNHLLHLLGKHGYQARIDLREAKRIIAEREM